MSVHVSPAPGTQGSGRTVTGAGGGTAGAVRDAASIQRSLGHISQACPYFPPLNSGTLTLTLTQPPAIPSSLRVTLSKREPISVFAACGCHTRTDWAAWNNRNVVSLALEARSPASGRRQGQAPSEPAQEETILVSSRSCPSFTCGPSLPFRAPSSRVSPGVTSSSLRTRLCPSPRRIRTSHGTRAHRRAAF